MILYSFGHGDDDHCLLSWEFHMLYMCIHLHSHCNRMVILGHRLDAKPFLDESMLVASSLWPVPSVTHEQSSGNLSIPPNCNELVEQKGLCWSNLVGWQIKHKYGICPLKTWDEFVVRYRFDSYLVDKYLYDVTVLF